MTVIVADATPVSSACFLGLHHDEGADRCHGTRFGWGGWKGPCRCRCHVGHAEHRQ